MLISAKKVEMCWRGVCHVFRWSWMLGAWLLVGGLWPRGPVHHPSISTPSNVLFSPDIRYLMTPCHAHIWVGCMCGRAASTITTGHCITVISHHSILWLCLTMMWVISPADEVCSMISSISKLGHNPGEAFLNEVRACTALLPFFCMFFQHVSCVQTCALQPCHT